MKKTQKKSSAWRRLYMRYRFWLICINYNFDFLVLSVRCIFKITSPEDPTFASVLYRVRVESNIRVRVVSDIQTLAFGSSLYIWYNTAANVVNIAY